MREEMESSRASSRSACWNLSSARCRCSTSASAVTGGRDVRVAVAVAAHPGAELDPARGRLDRRVGFRQRALELVLQQRHRFPKRGVEIPEAGADLVGDLGPRGARAVGEPERGDLPFQRARVGDAGDLVVQVRLGIAQALGEPPQLVEHGAPLRLGRVRGKDELDAELVEDLLHRLRRDVARLQLTQRGADRLAHRRAALLVLGAAAAAQEPDAVRFLGQVDQLEIDREGHRHVRRVGDRELPHGRFQLLSRRKPCRRGCFWPAGAAFPPGRGSPGPPA